MSNDYFNADTTIPRHSKAKSPVLNSIFLAIASGFGLLPSKDKLHQNRVTHYADTGTADNYVITMAPVPASYVDGLSVRVVIGNTNTGACTINVNALGAREVKAYDNSTPAAGDLAAGDVVDLVFHASRNAFLMLSQSRTFTVRAETAAGAAETAKGTAVTAASEAGTARDEAVTAKEAAETAKQGAEIAASGSLTKINNLSDLQNAGAARSNLGLGDAATKTVQSSPTDATAGKVLLNGGHGLGGVGINAPNGDCNDITASGLYTFDSATVNSPPFTLNGTILHIARTGTIHTQLAISRASSSLGRFAVRAVDPATGWSEWREGYTQGSILGTVSQSGGVPTGALIQRGRNANGEYVRLADGTQICTNQAFQTSDTADTTWTYPASFLYPASPGRPAVSGAISAVFGQASFLSIGGIAGSGSVATQVDVRGIDVNGNRVALAASLIAIGRWF